MHVCLDGVGWRGVEIKNKRYACYCLSGVSMSYLGKGSGGIWKTRHIEMNNAWQLASSDILIIIIMCHQVNSDLWQPSLSRLFEVENTQK